MSTHGPIEERWAQAMTGVMKVLDEAFNRGLKPPHKKVGIVMLMFDYGIGTGRSNYISNGVSRESMIELFRELADRFEGTHPEERE